MPLKDKNAIRAKFAPYMLYNTRDYIRTRAKAAQGEKIQKSPIQKNFINPVRAAESRKSESRAKVGKLKVARKSKVDGKSKVDSRAFFIKSAKS